MATRDLDRAGRVFPPVRSWLPGYERAALGRDAVGGLTVWALVVPESMAYASIAGVPVEYGLYSVPLAVLGTSCSRRRGGCSWARAPQWRR